MKREKQDELIDLLDIFSKELNCNRDCGNCEYGILRGYEENWSCPLELVEDMVWNKFNNNK